LLLAGILLVAAALAVVFLLTAPGPLDAARARYGRIREGMGEDEVQAILKGWVLLDEMGGLSNSTAIWYDPNSGVQVRVHFRYAQLGYDGRITDKDIDEGDQSFRAKVERLRDRLADRLHLGP
jgi:hypothetical protein